MQKEEMVFYPRYFSWPNMSYFYNIQAHRKAKPCCGLKLMLPEKNSGLYNRKRIHILFNTNIKVHWRLKSPVTQSLSNSMSQSQKQTNRN